MLCSRGNFCLMCQASKLNKRLQGLFEQSSQLHRGYVGFAYSSISLSLQQILSTSILRARELVEVRRTAHCGATDRQHELLSGVYNTPLKFHADFLQ
jgi:hypothetical protein